MSYDCRGLAEPCSTYDSFSRFCCFLQKSTIFQLTFHGIENDTIFHNSLSETPSSVQGQSIETISSDLEDTPSTVYDFHRNQKALQPQAYETLDAA